MENYQIIFKNNKIKIKGKNQNTYKYRKHKKLLLSKK